MAQYRLGVDVGGTFTDFALSDRTASTYVTGKVLTTPDDPSRAMIEGAKSLLSRQGMTLADIGVLVHGTTLVANTLIERNGAVTALVTTRGFRDTLEIGREIRYDVYDLFIERPATLVPRSLTWQVGERLSAEGEIVEALEVNEVLAVGHELAARGVEAVAVCLLHGFRNPIHERQIAGVFEREWPRIHVSLSSMVCPEIREYERLSTTVANAYVHPRVAGYLDELVRKLRVEGFGGSLFVMLSSGGIGSVEHVRRLPVQLIESGPAGGAVGAAHVGVRARMSHVVAFDMGGTTAKLSLIPDAVPRLTHQLEVARVQRFKKGSGFILKVPSVEMMEIGAGGGSIAEVDGMGLLKVGPRSAGASPGPACYGFGGVEPTVTDADLVLGYLDVDYFLGGELKLDREAAERAIVERVARPLGMNVFRAAAGIHSIVNNSMAAAARVHAAEHGEDLRRYALLAFGGAGPVHACGVARLLGIQRIVCPPAAGTLSAFGFLVAPARVDLVRSYVTELDNVDWTQLASLYKELESEARRVLAEAGIESRGILYKRVAELRYAGQGYEIAVPLPDGEIDHAIRQGLIVNFHREYEQLFGRVRLDVPIEALTWRLTAQGPSMDIRQVPGERGPGRPAPRKYRGVHFGGSDGSIDCPVYLRYELNPGSVIPGPAIVEERESTTVIEAKAHGEVDDNDNLVVVLE